MLAQMPERAICPLDHQSEERDIMRATKFCRNVAELKYFGATVTRNYFVAGIESRRNMGNAYYYSVQNKLCSHLTTEKRNDCTTR
jgi:hypothetical protein